ncbi:MAG: hypothetical protein JHC85_04675 [Chthoniobacterales bacterium]|nr:hypothetical protein [Chthoniobacterales bacterium]
MKHSGILGGAVFAILIALSLWAGLNIKPTWMIEKTTIEAISLPDGHMGRIFKGKPEPFESVVSSDSSALWSFAGQSIAVEPSATKEIVLEQRDGVSTYTELTAIRHWGPWSLLPAITAVLLCFLLRDPVVSLAGGIMAGAFLMQEYDIPGKILIPEIGTATGATIMVLYLWFLGGMLGVWSRSGAAAAFAAWVTTHFVRGPRSAKFVTWLLGVIIFQGGTLSTVLVGTAVRPVADRQKVSHEELSFIVDATASPIAVLLPFNAWPIYVQAFIFVGGVPWLATETQRISFFFQCIPLYFYAALTVFFTLLTSFDKCPFLGKSMRAAVERARTTGELDAPGAEPLLSHEIEIPDVPAGYRPSVIEFILPIVLIVGLAVGTFFVMGSPQVLWAFGAALVLSMVICLLRGMSLRDLMEGVTTGLKGVVYGSVILLLAVVIGAVSQKAGGGPYLVGLLSGQLAPWFLPVALALLTMVISFSTGTSWGTFAVALPLAMPLAWGVAQACGAQHPWLYMAVCFAAVINGSVFGDQCSPISDTCVLSAVTTGCDLMDHVRTQLLPCVVAAAISVVLWAAIAAWCV